MAVDRKIFTEDVDVGLKANKEFTKFYLNCKIDGKTKQKIFEYTNKNILTYVQTDNYEVSMKINEDDPEDLQAICLKKNIDKIEQVQRLIQWADKYKIDHDRFSRVKGFVRQCNIFESFNNRALEEIPKEFFEIKKNSSFLDFTNNKRVNIF